MGKIGLIIEREYLSRVKKKSFVILTLLGPLLIAGIISLVLWLGLEDNQIQNILVVDQKKPVFANLESDARVQFTYGDMNLEDAKKSFFESGFDGILFIPSNIERSNLAQLYFKKQPSVVAQRNIENKVESIVEELKLRQYKINRKEFYDVKTNFSVQPIKFSETGKEEKVDNERTFVGFAFGLMIYLFIFLYGVQVMRGVIEEKTSRIVEVIISSVKPFQLMMGKILGVALVGLTQFLVWIVLTFTIVTAVTAIFFGDQLNPEFISNQTQMTPEVMQQVQGENQMNNQFNLADPENIINRINFPLMIGLFLFYFLGGYLLYAALFAAVGSAVDNETDTQQFMFPMTAPLILAYVMSTFIVQNPEGPLAFWFSIIPLTSPIVMLVRVAIGVGEGGIPLWEVGLSMGLLILGFIGAVWLAGKIYRTGILMYGKKVSYKEIWKWLRYSS